VSLPELLSSLGELDIQVLLSLSAEVAAELQQRRTSRLQVERIHLSDYFSNPASG
jgi:hypothetical protein